MASKFGTAGGIPERRVRPIWEAIDSRQFKNALKHSQALLSKYPNSPYALALKALILERMGKYDEALSVCLKAKEQLYINSSILVDDLTLSTLQIVFQRLDRLDLATGCYEYACGKYPNNLELMMGLFNCYVREYSFVKQQQTAIKMYKIAGEERFLLWAVCSIQLQVSCGDGDWKLLLLAEGLLKKHIASHSLHEPEALLVYISVLEQQAKFGDALEVLSGKLGSLLMIEVDKLRMQGTLLARAGDYDAAANVFRKILELCPDDWECFVQYLSCLLEDQSSLWAGSVGDHNHSPEYAVSKNSPLTDEVFDSRLSNASAFVQKLQADTSNDLIRCPHLALIEIEWRKHLYGKGSDEKLLEALMRYFLRFGHLACFSSDVKVFLTALKTDKKMDFLEELKRNAVSLSTIKSLGQSVTLYKLQQLIGNMSELPVSELVGSAVEMGRMYCRSLPLSKDLDPQESMHGEELLSMVSNVLVQLYWSTRHVGYILEAIMVLEFGLTIRRYVWQYKILLLHLYSHLGAFSLSYEWYKSLDVKNILFETVLHHIVPQMLVSPLWADLNDILKDYLKFMDDHFRESADLTFLAYRHRNYSKVIEFVQFKERLQRSYQYLMSRVEAPILQLKQNADNIEEEESVLGSLNCGIHFLELSNEIESKSLTFNEDTESRPWWTPTSDRNYLLEPFQGVSYRPVENRQQLNTESEASARRTIEKRSLLPRLIYTSIQCASVPLKENVGANGSISEPKISSELKILLERYAKFLGLPFKDAVEVLIGVSTGQRSYEVLSSNMIEWLNFAVFLNAWNLTTHELRLLDGDKHRPDTWHIVDLMLRKFVLEKIKSMELLSCSAGVELSFMVQLITEPLAWHVLIIRSCTRSCIPSGKKKKKLGTADQLNSSLSRGTRASVQSLCGILENVVNWLRGQINRPAEESSDALMSSIHGSDRNEGPGQVLHVIEALTSSTDETELGSLVADALKLWSPVDVARKLVSGQCKVLSEFLRICESKLKSLQALSQQLSLIQA